MLQLKHEKEYVKVHLPIENTLVERYYFIYAISDAVIGDSPMFTSIVTPATRDSSHIELPKIYLTKFDGCIIHWRSFHVTFMSLVH